MRPDVGQREGDRAVDDRGPFEGGRHERRVEKIREYEERR